MMMSQATEIDWSHMEEAIPAFLTLIIMPFTFSISNGIVFGLLTAFVFHITTGALFIDILTAFGYKSRKGYEYESILHAEATDDQVWLPVVRTPSLILEKKVVDEVRHAKGRNIPSTIEENIMS
jgi:hypothetical protein